MNRPYIALRLLFLLLLLFIFLVSISLIGKSFGLFGEDTAHKLLTSVANPLAGLFVGILATSLVQSSSTTTSVVVGLVGSGLVPVELAIPVIMGANIGTSITNTIVSVGHISRSREFERAFAASTVHDFFNLCAVIVLFPLEMATGFIQKAATFGATLFSDVGGFKFSSPIKMATKPLVDWIVELSNHSGILVLLFGLLLLFIALKYIVSTLRSMVLKRMETIFFHHVFKSYLRSIILGMILTVMVQSSSITTSLVIPLVGAGLLNLAQIYPYTLGANIGTTVTAFLAALATGSTAGITIAFSHLVFNISGTAIFLPLKRLPMFLAETLAHYSLKSKLFPFLYLLIVFFLIPIVFILTMKG